ncbi:MAG: M28 family peptidase [Desulfobacterales bacterium]
MITGFPIPFTIMTALAAILISGGTMAAQPKAPTGTADDLFLTPDPCRLEATVVALAGLDPPRSYRHHGSLERAAAAIEDRFAEAGYGVETQPFSVRGTLYRNLIASVGPDRGDRLVVGAHYDVCGDQPGADDNASGVAGLIEIARLVKPYADRLRYRVDFAAYSLEEPPFFGTPHMGSRFHARSLKTQGVSVRGMISLEMIGFFTDASDSQRFPFGPMRFVYPTTGNFIAVVGNVGSRRLVREIRRHMAGAGVGVESLAAPAWVPGVSLSDQSSFWRHGYRAVMITDTAFYRNPHYHLPTDTPDTLDYQRMAEVVKGVARAILYLD